MLFLCFGWCDSDCFPGCYSFCKVLIVCVLVVFFFVVVYVWVLSVVYESVFRYILLFAFLAEKRFGDCILRVCLGFCLIEVNIEGRWLLFSISA